MNFEEIKTKLHPKYMMSAINILGWLFQISCKTISFELINNTQHTHYHRSQLGLCVVIACEETSVESYYNIITEVLRDDYDITKEDNLVLIHSISDINPICDLCDVCID